MKESDFHALVEEALPELQRRYHLCEWWIYVQVVDEGFEGHVAECHMEEPYRLAQILVSKGWLKRADREEALAVLEHEVQHIALYPLEALRHLVIPLVDESASEAIEAEFTRCNERLRSLLGRLTRKGNNWDKEARHAKEKGITPPNSD